ncbi:MAG: glycosyltransferase [Proteobacteria bacterium]|nr:glycosyltransferase [Pseudomonadota bacterium]
MSRGLHLCLLGDANSVHLQRWSAEMQARGHRVSVVTARPAPIAGAGQRVLAPVARSRDWLWRVGTARDAIAGLKPDIVHAHYVTSYGYLAARIGRHPLVMTAWGSDLLVTPRASRLLHALTSWTLRRADLATGDSADLLDAIRAHAPGVPARLIHWGADLATFRPAEALPHAFGIASLRSWDANYNIDVVVDAVALLHARWPELPLELHLLGGGPLEAALRAQVDARGIAGQVRWHGRVGDAAMVDALRHCRVSVSVPTSDATSVSLLESMAMGLAVVATDLPANRAWLAADDSVLVPVRDAAALADALERLARDPADTERMARRNRARIETDGSRSAQMDAMDGLYRELWDQARARRMA